MKTLVVLGVLAVIEAGTVLLVHSHGGWNTLTGKAWAITYEGSRCSARPPRWTASPR